MAELEDRLSTELGVTWGRRKITMALQTALGPGKWYLDSPGTKTKGIKPFPVYYHLYWKGSTHVPQPTTQSPIIEQQTASPVIFPNDASIENLPPTVETSQNSIFTNKYVTPPQNLSVEAARIFPTPNSAEPMIGRPILISDRPTTTCPIPSVVNQVLPNPTTLPIPSCSNCAWQSLYFLKSQEHDKVLSDISRQSQLMYKGPLNMDNPNVLSVDQTLGAGRYGQVKQVHLQTKSDRVCKAAMKELSKSTAPYKVQHELRSLLMTNSLQCTPKLIGSGVSSNECPLIFMDLVGSGFNCGTIHSLLNQGHMAGKSSYWCKVAYSAISAIQELHHGSGLIHNDLKTDNLCVDKADGSSVKILDLGQAVSVIQAQKPRYNVSEPRPSHIHPELYAGNIIPSMYTDYYSLGYVIQTIQKKAKLAHCSQLSSIISVCMHPHSAHFVGPVLLKGILRTNSK